MTGDCLCLNLGLECWCPPARRSRPGRPVSRPHGTMAAVRHHYRHEGRGWQCEPCRRVQQRAWQDWNAARRLAAEQAARRAVLAEAAASVDGRSTRYRDCGQPVDGPVDNGVAA